MRESGTFPHLFEPLQVGTMQLRNRIMLPPHGAAVGNLWGSEDQAAQNIAYWASRAADGVAWIDGITGFVDNTLIVPGVTQTPFTKAAPAPPASWFCRVECPTVRRHG